MTNIYDTEVWVTKYALTTGIAHGMAQVESGISDRMISVKSPESFGGHMLFHKPYWHRTELNAKAHVRKMIAAKRKSIQKQLAKLDALEMEIK